MYFKGSILEAAKSLQLIHRPKIECVPNVECFKSAYSKLSLLYMYLESYHLNDAVNLVNSLIAIRHGNNLLPQSVQSNTSILSLSAGSDISYLSVPQLFSGKQKHRSSRKKDFSSDMPYYWVKDSTDLEVVQSFSRCMALYFCFGYDILISPAHHPQNCPVLFTLASRQKNEVDTANKTENTRSFRLKERLKGHRFLPTVKSTGTSFLSENYSNNDTPPYCVYT